MALIGLLWTLDTLSQLETRARTGTGLDDFRLYTEQATSAAAALLMVPFVAWWLELFPLRKERPLVTFLGQLAGSGLFALGHYSLLIVLRIVVFAANGLRYGGARSHLDNLVFEYQKDIKIYLGMVAIIALYRQFRRRTPTSQADPATLAGDAAPRAGPYPGKIVVQTGRGERLLSIGDIDYLEAARNYVSIHSGRNEYLLRETLASLEGKLAQSGFLRTHRSFIVNVERIAEIRAASGGACEIVLESGQHIPLSRGYRDAVRKGLEMTGVRIGRIS